MMLWPSASGMPIVVSLFPGQTFFGFLLLYQFAVQAQLLFQVSIKLPTTKQRQQPSAEFAKPIHGNFQKRRLETGNGKLEGGDTFFVETVWPGGTKRRILGFLESTKSKTFGSFRASYQGRFSTNMEVHL